VGGGKSVVSDGHSWASQQWHPVSMYVFVEKWLVNMLWFYFLNQNEV
jgi:hypothetical protein